jgi:hypothetical protein
MYAKKYVLHMKRKFNCVLAYNIPNSNKENPEDYFYYLVLAFIPFRKKDEIYNAQTKSYQDILVQHNVLGTYDEQYKPNE